MLAAGCEEHRKCDWEAWGNTPTNRKKSHKKCVEVKRKEV